MMSELTKHTTQQSISIAQAITATGQALDEASHYKDDLYKNLEARSKINNAVNSVTTTYLNNDFCSK